MKHFLHRAFVPTSTLFLFGKHAFLIAAASSSGRSSRRRCFPLLAGGFSSHVAAVRVCVGSKHTHNRRARTHQQQIVGGAGGLMGDWVSARVKLEQESETNIKQGGVGEIKPNTTL